jgi:hypothetical protein
VDQRKSEFRICGAGIGTAFSRVRCKVLDGQERIAVFVFTRGAGKKFFDVFDVGFALIGAEGNVLSC